MSSPQIVAPALGAPRQRLEWMDALRGISILLVMANHAFVYTYDDILSAPKWLWAFNAAFEPLRMPLMVLLSGLLVPQSLAKGVGRYLSGKARNVLHPYFVWSAAMLVVLAGASVLVGRPFDNGQILRVFYWPLDHMWFLAYLFLYYLVAAATRRINPLWVASAALAVSFVPGSWRWDRFWLLLCFFMIGIAAARYPGVWRRVLGARWLLIPSAVAFVTLFVLSAREGDIRYIPVLFPLVLAGILGACILASAVGVPSGAKPVLFLGRESLVYYVAHVPIILVLVTVLAKVVPSLPGVGVFAAGWAVALGAGTVLALLGNRVPLFSWAFRFGGNRSRRLPLGG